MKKVLLGVFGLIFFQTLASIDLVLATNITVNNNLEKNDLNYSKNYSNSSDFYDVLNPVYTKNKKEVYFIKNTQLNKNKSPHFEIFKADVVSDTKWVNILKLPINGENYSINYPCLNDNDNILYYSSNKGNFNSFSNMDLYKITIIGRNSFGIAEKMSKNINTSKNEIYPYIHNNILYFSSNGRKDSKGLDVYKVDLSLKKLNVIKLSNPVNSNFDDYNFRYDFLKNDFSLLSNRKNGIEKKYYYKKIKNWFILKNSFIDENTTNIPLTADFKKEKELNSNLIAQNSINTLKKENLLLINKNQKLNNEIELLILKGEKSTLQFEKEKALLKQEILRLKEELAKYKNIKIINNSIKYIKNKVAVSKTKAIEHKVENNENLFTGKMHRNVKLNSSTNLIKVEKSPVFKGCDNLIDQEKVKKCFVINVFQNIIAEINPNTIKKSNLAKGVYDVRILFIVNKEGKSELVHIVGNWDKVIKDEIKRVINNLPRMKPGYTNGMKMDVKYSFKLPIIIE